MMSGTRVTTTRRPLTSADDEAHEQDEHDDEHRSSAALCISTAAMTLVNAMTEPIERSIPPEITTIAWAAAASATGSDGDGQRLERRSRAGGSG